MNEPVTNTNAPVEEHHHERACLILQSRRSPITEAAAQVLANGEAKAVEAERSKNEGEWSTLMADLQDYYADEKADRTRGRITHVFTLLGGLRAERDALKTETEHYKRMYGEEESMRRNANLANDQLRAEVARLNEREALSDTLDKGQKLALIRALQEIRDAMDMLGGNTLSPREIVEAVVLRVGELAQAREKVEAYQRQAKNAADYIRKMDGIIEEVGGITVSCINPYMDLKLALIALKEKAQKADEQVRGKIAFEPLREALQQADDTLAWASHFLNHANKQAIPDTREIIRKALAGFVQ